MHVAKLQIDRLGQWSNVTLGPLEPGLNVVCGPGEQDRAALGPFIRTLLFGGRDRTHPLHPSPRQGSLTVWGPQGLLTVHRHEQGRRQDRWLVETEQGAMVSPCRLDELLGTASAELFERVFMVDFHRPRSLDLLLETAHAHGLSVIGGHGDPARFDPLRQRLSQQRERLDRVVCPEAPLAVLLERHRRLRTEVEALAAAGRQHEEHQARQRTALQTSLVEYQGQLERARAEHDGLEAEIERRQAERQQQEQQVAQARFEHQQVIIDRRRQVGEIEQQLQRWRLVLCDLETRRARLRAETEGETGNDGAGCDPGDCLHRIERGVEQLQASVGQWPGTPDHDAGQQGVFPESSAAAKQSMLEQVAQLQEQLTLWRVAVRQTDRWQQGGQLKRCVRELRAAIHDLARERRELLDDVANRQRRWGLPSDGLAGSSSETPSSAEQHAGGDQPIELGEEMLAVMDAELKRLDQRRSEVQTEIERLEDELQQVGLELESVEPAGETNPHRPRFDIKKEELEHLEQQIGDSRQRQEIAAEVEKLESEIRSLEAATAETDVLRQAATFLRIFSGQHLERIVITPERTVHVVTQRGNRLGWNQLDGGQQDQLRLGLTLAVVAALAHRGIRLPLILQEVFLRQHPARWSAIANVLRDFARPGHQILLVLGSPAAVDFFRSRQIAVHRLPSSRQQVPPCHSNGRWSALDRGEINQQLNAIAQETAGGGFDEAPAFSAEEFPGERTDRVRRPSTRQEPESAGLAEGEGKDYFLTERAPIHEAPSIDAATAERFREIGVGTVGDLLRLSASETANRLRHAGITARMIRRWQREALLVCRIARLRPYDARILVACGIESPEQLARLDARQLRRRVEAFAETSLGQVLMQAGNPYEMLRLTRWIQAAHRTPGLRAA